MRAIYIAWCHMVLHDQLYYASREFGRFYETEKYLHNYGLTYALGLVRPAPTYFHHSQEPSYEEELQSEYTKGIYVTPAAPLHVDFAFITFKMAAVPYYSKTPPEDSNRVLFGRAKELAVGSTFEFFVLAQEEHPLPRWVRLGKWMSKAEITYQWYMIGSPEARVVEVQQPQLVSCCINPLDIDQHRLKAFDVIVMPPASLLVNARVTGTCCKLIRGENKQKEERYIPLFMGYFHGKDSQKHG